MEEGISDEVSIIDSNVKSMKSLSIPRHTKILNLHANAITKIENLTSCTELRHLDLSGNNISSLKGLKNLQYLRTLNMSCNKLTSLEGIGELRSLIKLNAAYNQISDIIALKELHGCSFPLSSIELQGNKLASMKKLLDALRGLLNLRSLCLQEQGVSNPVCSEAGYQGKLLAALPKLETLDGKDRAGVKRNNPEILADIPGLEQYMDFLVSSTDSSLSTPAIDAAMQKYRRRKIKDSSSSEMDVSAKSFSDVSVNIQDENSVRIELLEREIRKLMRDRETERQNLSSNQRPASRQSPRQPANQRSPEVSSSKTSRRRSASPSEQLHVVGASVTSASRTSAETTAAKAAAAKAVQEDVAMRTAAAEAMQHLKRTLMNEREARGQAQGRLEQLQADLEEMNQKYVVCAEAEASKSAALRSLQAEVADKEHERLERRAQDAKRLQQLQMRAAASGREVELLRAQLEALKNQNQQLQELLVSREQQYRRDVDSRLEPGSAQVSNLIARETDKLCKQHEERMEEQREKVLTLQKQYNALEEEFREALTIESRRFNELQSAYEETSSERAHAREALLELKRKENNAQNVIGDLTSLVKEQKGRISELTKSKQEMTSEYKERVDVLETHLDEARRRMVQLELLKKEKVQLTSQANESMVAGLKQERKLWSEELAQQGAALSQDRGRLESKIESLRVENDSLRKQLDAEVDAVKIKTKLLEDQTDTIRRLKDGLLERDQQIKGARDDALRGQRDLEQQLRAETAVAAELQEKLDRARDRKEELKLQLTDLEEKYEISQKGHETLKTKWKDKSTLIGQLEQQVTQMKSTWDNKEAKLTEERDKAVNAAKLAIEKLKQADDGFRDQLEAAQQAHDETLRDVEMEHEKELAAAHKKVSDVEDEMRDLLEETQQQKRAMDSRVKQLNKALTALQHDLI